MKAGDRVAKRYLVEGEIGSGGRDNCAKGALDEGRGRAHHALARALGVVSEADADAAIAALEREWLAWLQDLEAPPLGVLEGSRFTSTELGVSFDLPAGFKRMRDEDLGRYAIGGFRKGTSSIEITTSPRESSGGEERLGIVRAIAEGEVPKGQERTVSLASGGEAVIHPFKRPDGTNGEVLLVDVRAQTHFFVATTRGLVEPLARSLKVLAR